MRRPYGFEINENCGTCALRKTDFFCQLENVALRHFEAIKSLSVYPPNAVLFLERENPRGIFLVCEGQVKLYFTSKEGKTLTLKIAKPGELLGLSSVMSGSPYPATAETLRPSQIAFVRRDDFLKFIKSHARVYEKVVKEMAVTYDAVCDQLRTASFSSTPKRLARLLLDMAVVNPKEKSDQINMPLTHEEIGELIGSTRETVTRTLSEFKERHLITVIGAAMTIHNRKALQEMAVA